MRGRVVLVRIGAAALRDDGLPLGEQVVANVHRLAEQAAGIAAQVEDQALEVAKALDGVFHFLAGGLLELGEVDVADAGANLVLQVDGGVRNLVANQVEDQRLGLRRTRVIVTWTCVPLGPLSALATWSEVQPSVLLPSTAAMTSPG